MGDWLRQNGAGVYGTCGGPFKPGRWGAATCKANKIYLFIMRWPDQGPLVLPALDVPIQSVRLAREGELKWDQNDAGISVVVPPSDRDPIATVVELTVAGQAPAIQPVDVPYHSRSLAFASKATASNVFHKSPQYTAAKALDDDTSTRWATDAGTDSSWLEVDFRTPRTFSQVMIDEPAEYCRVEAFELQAQDDAGEWKTFFKGKQIGPRWKTEFSPITAQRVRLNILKASEGPTLCEFQLLAPDAP